MITLCTTIDKGKRHWKVHLPNESTWFPIMLKIIQADCVVNVMKYECGCPDREQPYSIEDLNNLLDKVS